MATADIQKLREDETNYKSILDYHCLCTLAFLPHKNEYVRVGDKLCSTHFYPKDLWIVTDVEKNKFKIKGYQGAAERGFSSGNWLTGDKELSHKEGIKYCYWLYLAK
jgi:hypothetical protein